MTETADAPLEGTVNSMAPEQRCAHEGVLTDTPHRRVVGRRVTTKADLYALGIMMLQMATERSGTHPGRKLREFLAGSSTTVEQFFGAVDRGKVRSDERTSFVTKRRTSEPIEWAAWFRTATDARDVLIRLLTTTPSDRPSAHELQQHAWFQTRRHSCMTALGCLTKPSRWCY